MLGSEACGFGASICLSVKGFNLPPLGASMAPMDGGRPIASILEGRSARRQACLLLVKSPVVIELLVLRSGTVWHRGTGFQCLNSSACLRACRDLNGVACCFKAERALARARRAPRPKFLVELPDPGRPKFCAVPLSRSGRGPGARYLKMARYQPGKPRT